MIPRTLHFCFGLSPDFGGKPWGLVHHACLRRAVAVLRPERVLFHHEHEPRGPWWDLSRPLVTPVRLRAPTEVFGNRLHRVEHQADVVRLRALVEHGGIYLDADVFVHRDFDDLLGHAAVLAFMGEGDRTIGLGNAVILAEPGAAFLRRWLADYRSFASRGYDAAYIDHSIKRPLGLWQAHRQEARVLDARAFYHPWCDQAGLRRIFDPGEDCDAGESYATHLWESLAWRSYLQDLTPGRVRAHDSAFHRWVRPLVAGLPDDFGKPGAVARGLRQVNRVVRRVRRMIRGTV